MFRFFKKSGKKESGALSGESVRGMQGLSLRGFMVLMGLFIRESNGVFLSF